MQSGAVPRRWVLRGAVLALVVLLAGAATATTVTYEPPGLGPGTVEEVPDGDTVVSIQGFHFQGIGNKKKPARLVRAGPNATTEWRYSGARVGATWFYDVDPLPNGHLLVSSTRPGETNVYELDPETDERVWSQQFDIHDTHDVAMVGEDELLVANMRNTGGNSSDRLFVYNLTREEIVWEWRFDEHFPRSGGGDYAGDWTHVNDVEEVREGEYMASVRNFDQVIVVNRSTKAIEWRLGSDGEHSVLYEQHNPDYLEGPNGTRTVLVADSENDRVVEYAWREGNWTRTWTVTGFTWPRDADRLPNGNTLVTDSLNHRVVEITPRGEVVWEYYAAWAPYDAERVGPDGIGTSDREFDGGGSYGPTIAEQNASGTYRVSGGAGDGPSVGTVGAFLQRSGLTWLGERYSHVVPFVRPVWIPSWSFLGYLLAALLLLGWGVGELVANRGRVRRRLGRVRVRGD